MIVCRYDLISLVFLFSNYQSALELFAQYMIRLRETVDLFIGPNELFSNKLQIINN